MKRHCTRCRKSSVKTKFHPVTHVIFDLDGVILDSENVYREAFQKTMEDYGHPLTYDFYRQVSGTTSPALAEATIKQFNLEVAPEDFIRKYRSYSQRHMSNVQLLPGAEKIIRHLHETDIPIAIATSSAKSSFLAKTEKFDHLISLFNHVVCGDDPDVTKSKPQPDVFLVCASRFVGRPEPSNCLVFEDSPNGLKAALAAGMHVVMIPNETVPEEIWKLATLKIDCLEQMKPELFGLPPFPDISKDND